MVLVLLSKVVSNNLRWLLSNSTGERCFSTPCEEAGDNDDGVDVHEDDGDDDNGRTAQGSLDENESVGDDLRSLVRRVSVAEVLPLFEVVATGPFVAKHCKRGEEEI